MLRVKHLALTLTSAAGTGETRHTPQNMGRDDELFFYDLLKSSDVRSKKKEEQASKNRA
jgi:hypothetical protein